MAVVEEQPAKASDAAAVDFCSKRAAFAADGVWEEDVGAITRLLGSTTLIRNFVKTTALTDGLGRNEQALIAEPVLEHETTHRGKTPGWRLLTQEVTEASADAPFTASSTCSCCRHFFQTK